jgi:hypothetical protein
MNNLTKLQKEIVEDIKVEYEPLKISVIDSIKILKDCINTEEQKLFKILRKYKQNNDLSDIDAYIVDKILNSFYLDLLYIKQTYYDNLILEVYFILNNPFLYSSYQLKAIHNNLDLIKIIPNLIRKCLQKTYDTPHLKNFFNKFLFDRWLNSLDFQNYSFEKYVNIVGNNGNNEIYYNMYSNVWIVFKSIVNETKNIIKEFCEKYRNLNHIPGCKNISKEFYEYCAETNVGLPFGKEINLKKILKWSIKEFEKIKISMKDTIIKLEPGLKDKQLNEMIEYIQ